jgi:Interferon-induced transmembrane protein
MTQQPPPGNYPPPTGGGYQQPGTQPNNHLVWAILTTLFCCLPLGIVSIVKSAQVSGLWASGRYADAQQAADSAKKWAMWSAIIGIVAFVIYGVLIAAGAISMDMDTSSA